MKFYFFLIWILFPQKLLATQVEKKFEWGAGFLSLYGNHYRGSNQEKYWLFPIPYFTYKSKIIEAEPSFIRGLIFHNEWLSFKLSLVLGLNVESKKNYAREGMPSLDYTIEAGPMFIFHLWKSSMSKIIINLELPIRETFATNLTYLKPVGVFTIPYLSITHLPSKSTWNWNSEFSIGPMFGDQGYHQYFYGVDQKYAREGRSFYHAHSGYSGLQSAFVFNKRIDNLIIIPFIRWDYLKGTTFEDSPLVKIKSYTLVGLGFFWMFN